MGLTQKQEAFCQAIVSGKNQADAYRAAYNAEKMKAQTVQSNASRLMADSKVAARVEELRRPVVEKVQYDLEKAMGEADQALQVALKKEHPGAMVAAVTLKAKLNGLLIEKREDVTDPLKKAIANMPAEKAQQMIEALDQVEAIRKKAKSAA